MNSLKLYIERNGSSILNALYQHIELSLIATIITIIIAIPLAIILINHKRIGEVVLQITSIIQTIPSLAILGILIPFVGIGTTPAIIALVLYAIMPVFSNTYEGLTNIDPTLIEAANAFGVSKRFKLFRIQIPLAFPMILTGIRIAVVMIIGTATLAALIGGGGLGTYIMLGIQTNNNNALLVGAIFSSILTLSVSILIKLISKLSLKKIAISTISLMVLISGITIYQKFINNRENNTITIAGKLGSEPDLLINMYKDLIQSDDPQIHVKLEPNFGGSNFLFQALKSNQINIYPEFTGTILQSFVNKPNVPHNSELAYNVAKKEIKNKYDMTLLKHMKYQNTYAITVRTAEAKKYHLRTIADLKKLPQFKAAFDPDFYQQPDGYVGLKKAYQLKFASIKTMEPSLRYQALANGRVNVTDAYSTDPQIKQYHLTVLSDDHHFFPPYQGAPLIQSQFGEQHPQIIKSLNRLNNKVNDEQIRSMNYQVTVKHKSAASVAKQFLITHHLLNHH